MLRFVAIVGISVVIANIVMLYTDSMVLSCMASLIVSLGLSHLSRPEIEVKK